MDDGVWELRKDNVAASLGFGGGIVMLIVGESGIGGVICTHHGVDEGVHLARMEFIRGPLNVIGRNIAA